MSGEPASETARTDTPIVNHHGGVAFTITFEKKLTERQQEDIKHHVTALVDYLETYYDTKNNGIEVPPPPFALNPDMTFV